MSLMKTLSKIGKRCQFNRGHILSFLIIMNMHLFESCFFIAYTTEHVESNLLKWMLICMISKAVCSNKGDQVVAQGS